LKGKGEEAEAEPAEGEDSDVPVEPEAAVEKKPKQVCTISQVLNAKEIYLPLIFMSI